MTRPRTHWLWRSAVPARRCRPLQSRRRAARPRGTPAGRGCPYPRPDRRRCRRAGRPRGGRDRMPTRDGGRAGRVGVRRLPGTRGDNREEAAEAALALRSGCKAQGLGAAVHDGSLAFDPRMRAQCGRGAGHAEDQMRGNPDEGEEYDQRQALFETGRGEWCAAGDRGQAALRSRIVICLTRASDCICLTTGRGSRGSLTVFTGRGSRGSLRKALEKHEAQSARSASRDVIRVIRVP